MNIFILEDDEQRIKLFEEAASKNKLNLTIARTCAEAKKKYEGGYTYALLDHDLGHRQMVDSSEEETGYTFCKWLVEQPTAKPAVVVHSFNPDGARNMGSLLLVKGIRAIPFMFGPDLLKWMSEL